MREKGENGEMLQGLRSIISRNKIDSGEVKNSRGNGESKEVTHTTHGHELRAATAGGKGVPGRGGQREKNWDNCNSIINKIYFTNISGRVFIKLLVQSPASERNCGLTTC